MLGLFAWLEIQSSESKLLDSRVLELGCCSRVQVCFDWTIMAKC